MLEGETMNDKIVIDRDRLVRLQERLTDAEPLSEGNLRHDHWVFAMQNVANMLEYKPAEIVPAEPSGADRYATLQDVDHAIRELRAEFRRHVGDADDGHAMRNEVRNDMAMHVESEREYIDACFKNHSRHWHMKEDYHEQILAAITEALKAHWEYARDYIDGSLMTHQDNQHEHGGLVTEWILDKALNTITDRIMALEQRQALLSQLFAEEIQSHEE
jgi:hypothetical protein